MRRRVALEAARLISEQGIRDFRHAKHKAAERLSIHEQLALPSNGEIEAALREHQRLFLSQSQPSELRQYRLAALAAMRFLSHFEPRLVGAVLNGTADEHSAVCLHLFSDPTEQVNLYLAEHGISYTAHSRRLRMDHRHEIEVPVILLSMDNLPFDLTVLPRDGLQQSPLDRIDHRPLQRANLRTVQELLKSKGPS